MTCQYVGRYCWCLWMKCSQYKFGSIHGDLHIVQALWRWPAAFLSYPSYFLMSKVQPPENFIQLIWLTLAFWNSPCGCAFRWHRQCHHRSRSLHRHQIPLEDFQSWSSLTSQDTTPRSHTVNLWWRKCLLLSRWSHLLTWLDHTKCNSSFSRFEE